MAAACGTGFAVEHFVPADKKLDPRRVAGLFARGERNVYRGEEALTIGMPVGGICAGQVYLGGDGRLLHWDIFNRHDFSGYGAANYQYRTPGSPLSQGFEITAVAAGKTATRTLDRRGFPGAAFTGEYPIGTVEYRDADFPLAVTLEAFSPFIPLDAADSGLPATVLRFEVENPGREAVEARLHGWLENGVCLDSSKDLDGRRRNRIVREEGLVFLECAAEPPPAGTAQPAAPPEIFADFEGDDYGDWTVEGEAFGRKPAGGTLPDQQPVSGFEGKGLVNTYLGGDGPRGRLVSPEFAIRRPFINFLIGGGGHAGSTCINLLVDGKTARTATGRNNERLVWSRWDVRDLAGKTARIEIIDRASGGWGHINIDQIEFADRPRSGRAGPLAAQEDSGTMGLALIGPVPTGGAAEAVAGWNLTPHPLGGFRPDSAAGPLPAEADGSAAREFGKPLIGSLERSFRLDPGARRTVVFLVAWCFPNHARGRRYAERFESALAVARYVAANLERLAGATELWRRAYYDSTLPRWLLDRLHMPVSILASSTVQWWRNGRFWAWEGVGCCHGTCTHVWNYAHAPARLFPELERSAREMQDFGEGFDPRSGLVGFRGAREYAADGQCGTVLKTYREHLVSADDGFLRRLWPSVRKAVEFLLRQDSDDDGLIENSQHNTYDINFEGPNTFVGSLYLAALRAAEEMARRMGEEEFATRCRRVFELGSRRSMEKLYNGEYFIQVVDLEKHPRHQYGPGCLSDQLFGQGWAHQLGLGYLYPREAVLGALKAVFKYNWAPDVGPHNAAHPPERWFASPGEAGLFTCTWPASDYLREGVRYREEVWTGIEYQVAGHMLHEGLLVEGLAIIRAVHDRYDGRKHNPWNEVECGDHYARAMASWGCLIAISGFEYDGPAGRIGFAPRITPEDFRAPFTAAAGWGTLAQKRDAASQESSLALRRGELHLREVGVEAPPELAAGRVAVRLDGRQLPARIERGAGGRVAAILDAPVTLAAGNVLAVHIEKD